MRTCLKDARINLRGLREERGWIQKELAARLEITREHLSAIETGRRKITLKMMRKLMDLFDLDYVDFFKYDDL